MDNGAGFDLAEASRPKRFISTRRIQARRILTVCVVVVATALLAVGGWAIFLQLTGNIHTVRPNELYRSAQLDGDDLARVLDEYRIKSVINLRGGNPGDAWYDEELKVTNAHGVQHFDVGIGATSEPEPKVMRRLIGLLRNAPRPILVHCFSGADRSGLAAALYEFLVTGESARTAARQLSFWYGHFPWLGSRTVAMDHAYWRIIKGGEYSALSAPE
ncbi:MAG: tyrosine-protein phosphatase [Proteobacteria bacterium]|nr:tyrosine-protein phosphatase [Pseudomonadota bacterium]